MAIICYVINILKLQIRFNGNTFMVWDVGGQDKLRPLWRSYTRCTDGIIFVVDSCRDDRLEEAKLELLNICKSSSSKRLASTSNALQSPVPVLILANKQDLPSAMDVARIERCLGLKEQLGVKGKSWYLQPTCAVTGEGLEEGMAVLTDMINQRKSPPKPAKVKVVPTSDRASTGSSNLSSSGSNASSSSVGSQIRSTGTRPVFGSSSRRVRRSHSHVR